ncbi:hypothetical protein HMP0721_1028 [Pseudoramibacter alactolyticus ATCC 23263]|uniref:Uncharacterized protein n=1 Tax=Pseudoramibacter alactolyticus ATCC 23263 TaxID=887929 RepID=E6MG95_9FIRM|nr:hypothetical protein HMP0721_1028 [Pseudoramibacter alactolyticus ATCC 23263]
MESLFFCCAKLQSAVDFDKMNKIQKRFGKEMGRWNGLMR